MEYDVTDQQPEKDGWWLPALALWMFMFLIGLVPEPLFYLLRDAGDVVSQRALVNSPYLITLALSFYIAIFAFGACRRAGLTILQAQDRALQIGIVALIAFLPIDLNTILEAHSNPLLRARFALYLAAFVKIAAWWYLLTLFIRYYGLNAEDVFAKIPSLFPSTRKNNDQIELSATENPLPSHSDASEIENRPINFDGSNGDKSAP
jgi:hypothetical protein